MLIGSGTPTTTRIASTTAPSSSTSNSNAAMFTIDMASSQVLRQPAPALEIQLQLFHAAFRAHIELGAGRSARCAIGRQTVSPLEPLHGLLERLVEELGVPQSAAARSPPRRSRSRSAAT